jgi:hypothetical protein
MHRGFIKIWKKITEWEWYHHSNTFCLFIHLLIKANYKDGNFLGHTIPRGSLVDGLYSLSEDTGISVQSIRTSLNHLKSTKEITIKSTNKFSIITLCNYENYQDQKNEINTQINTQINKQSTNNQQTTNKQLTTIIELKEIKNDKNNTIHSWRTDFEIYQKDCSDAFDRLIADWRWIKERKNYHHGLNIRKSAEKMFFDYWGTQEGWKKKKSSKTKEIDWMATVNNGLSLKCNQVWIQKNETDEELEFIQIMEARNAKTQ